MCVKGRTGGTARVPEGTGGTAPAPAELPAAAPLHRATEQGLQSWDLAPAGWKLLPLKICFVWVIR